MVVKSSKRDQSYLTIPVDQISFDSDNIRRTKSEICGLKQTISDVGLLQPILLYRSGERYVVIDGERRLRAMMDLGIKELILGRDVIVDAEETAADIKFKQVIANIQREDINDIELGRAFVLLNEQYGYRYNEVADILGKTPHYVTAKVGLAKRLCTEVQALYMEDLENARCIPDTSSTDSEPVEQPYVMSVNVVQYIARLPVSFQMQSYLEIRTCQMDKKEAYRYLQSVRANSDDLLTPDCISIIDSNNEKPGKEQKIVLKRYLNRLDKDVDRFTEKVKSDGYGTDAEVIPAIESLISKLQSLYAELKAGGIEREVDVLTT